MASLNGRVIFITTSPRTAEKIIPEIDLLDRYFHGKPWNHLTQTQFMDVLRDENFFNGEGSNDPAFSARDRINRAPKAYGFVRLTPTISLTAAGARLVNSKRKHEVFLRQLLKFQLPSPFHRNTDDGTQFCVKPFLEIFRLIKHFGTLKFDELQIFGLQLVDYHLFDSIVEKIDHFRTEKITTQEPYRQFKARIIEEQIREIYAVEIQNQEIETRESPEVSIENFIRTKASNMRDYADACVRYLRATGMVNISHIGRSLSIIPERMDEMDFILEHISQEPVYVNDEAAYTDYLGSASLPKLLNDDLHKIVRKIQSEFPGAIIPENSSIEQLKELLDDLIVSRQQNIIHEQMNNIKDYRMYDDIQEQFNQILTNRALYDAPLLLEWNTWRAMTMLDGGTINANLKFDDFGKPMSTAQGNMSDIECDYGDFCLSVEVTMQGGARQYETEGEPVSRHLGKLKAKTQKPSYCLFIAPTINPAVISHFYLLHKLDIELYGGKSTIIPLPLNIFIKMVEDSYKAEYVPEAHQVRQLFLKSEELANSAKNENEWYAGITDAAMNWLTLN